MRTTRVSESAEALLVPLPLLATHVPRWVAIELLEQLSLGIASEGDNLEPAEQRHRRDRGHAVGHVGEVDTIGRREVARESEELREQVAYHGCGWKGLTRRQLARLNWYRIGSRRGSASGEGAGGSVEALCFCWFTEQCDSAVL